MEQYEELTVLDLIRRIIRIIAIVAIPLELLFFPSMENLAGCFMMATVTIIFTTFFLKRYIIVDHPFPFMMFLSMFLYRYLPLPCTMLERKPVSYGMEVAVATFLLETLSFLMGCIAFSIICRSSTRIRGLRVWYNTFHFYNEPSDKLIWIIGLMGIVARTATISLGDLENVSGALMTVVSGIVRFRYMPLILFFPGLFKVDSEKTIDFAKPILWIYTIIIEVLNLATNSRNEILYPIGIIVLLWLLAMCVEKTKISQILAPKRLIVIFAVGFISVSFLISASDAMLSVRNVRSDVGFFDLLKLTVKEMTSMSTDDVVDSLTEVPEADSYSDGWTEEYLDNAFLNRYANMRITDETLYYITQLDDNDIKALRKDFYNRIISIAPQPLLNLLGIDINKAEYHNSRGDVLCFYAGYGNSYTLHNYIVTSHLADGIVEFGVFYFPIQCLLWIVCFKLQDLFATIFDDKRIYSLYGLMSVYAFLAQFRNANGVFTDVGYILRSYWQGIFIFTIVYFMATVLSRVKVK